MAVQTTNTDVIYIEDGSTLTFPFTDFTIFEETDLVVTSILTSSGAQTLLVLNTDYTVTINSDGTGDVVKSIAKSNLFTLVIQRVLPILQQIVLVDNEGTDASTYEEGYDRLTMIAQQLQAQIDRSVLQPITVDTPIAFPAPVASTYLGFDVNGNLTTFTTVSAITLTPITPSVALDIAQVNAGGTNLQYVSLASLLAALTAANLISGKILFQLGNIPAGAGIIPVANLPVGTTASKIIQLNGGAQIPALDGSLLTNLKPSGIIGVPVSKLDSIIYPAVTDGFIVAASHGDLTETGITITFDSVSPPAAYSVSSNQNTPSTANAEPSVSVVIPKGWFYTITVQNGGTLQSAYFIPIGF